MPKNFIYRRATPGTQPEYLHSPYVSTVKRAPKNLPIHLPHTLTEINGPVFDASMIDAKACDLTEQHGAAPLGERIIVSGRVLDENARPVPHTLVELWQA